MVWLSRWKTFAARACRIEWYLRSKTFDVVA